MKKHIIWIVMLTLVFSLTLAGAEDLGVQVIGGQESAMETVSLDDIQLGKTYVIEGYASLRVDTYNAVNMFAQFDKGANGNMAYGSPSSGPKVYLSNIWDSLKNARWKMSGSTAEFAMLRIDITNLQKQSVSISEDATVKVVYDEGYEFAGWVRQSNHDYLPRIYIHKHTLEANIGQNPLDPEGLPTYATELMLDPENDEPIAMMYTGHFFFGCTLPNEVITSKKPLRMEIKLGDNELTYHIRK